MFVKGAIDQLDILYGHQDYSLPLRCGNIITFPGSELSLVRFFYMTSPSAIPSLSQRLAGIAEVECVFPDMNGIPRGKLVNARAYIEGRRVHMAHGVLVQCLTGEYPDPRYYGYDDSDFILRTIPGQVHITPWTATPRALALCETLEMDGAPSRLSSRSMLQRVVERYQARGWSPKVATEIEFYLFEHNPDVLQPFRPPVGLDGRREVGNQAFAAGSTHALQPFFAELKAGMASLGIPCEAVLHEMGLSQYEVNFLHDDPLLIADQTFLFKYMLHEIALKHGLIAVCMAKPLSKMPGSSMHIHQSVVDQSGQNIFTDAVSQEPTELFSHHLGGLQVTAMLAGQGGQDALPDRLRPGTAVDERHGWRGASPARWHAHPGPTPNSQQTDNNLWGNHHRCAVRLLMTSDLAAQITPLPRTDLVHEALQLQLLAGQIAIDEFGCKELSSHLTDTQAS